MAIITTIRRFVESDKGFRSGRWLPYAVGLSVSAVVFLLGIDMAAADIKYDWLAVKGAFEENAYENILELAGRHGVSIQVNVPAHVSEVGAHPRTPGALILSSPLALMPFEWLVPAVFGLTSACLVFLCQLALVPSEASRMRKVLSAAALAISGPHVFTLQWAGLAGLVAVTALVAWRQSESGHEFRAAALFAAAVSLKVFPALLVIPWMLKGKWRQAVYAASLTIGINLAGLALPGVRLEDAIQALIHAHSTFGDLIGNGSLLRFVEYLDFSWIGSISISVASLVALILIASNGRLENSNVRQPWLWLLAGLLLTPLSWMSYDMVLIPLVLLYLNSKSDFHVLLGLGVISIWVALPPFFLAMIGIDHGFISAAIRIVLLAVVAWRKSSMTHLQPRESVQLNVQRIPTGVDHQRGESREVRKSG